MIFNRKIAAMLLIFLFALQTVAPAKEPRSHKRSAGKISAAQAAVQDEKSPAAEKTAEEISAAENLTLTEMPQTAEKKPEEIDAEADAHADVPLSPEERADQLFAAHDWQGLEELLLSEEDLPPRAISLVANAYWYQRRWDDSLALMEGLEKSYPKSVLPYARLLMGLALERTGRKKEAYALARSLYNDTTKEEKIPRYYGMYLLERLAQTVNEKEKWLRLMAAFDNDRSHRDTVMSELAKINRLAPEDALEILRVSPQNSDALKIAKKAPESPQKNYRLGYAAYLSGDYKTAINYLKRLDFNARYGESGTYYYGMSLIRLEREAEAIPLMVKLVYRKGSEHIQRAINRLTDMLGGKSNNAALKALLKMSDERNATIASAALYSLARSNWKRKDQARDAYLKRFPTGRRADALRWVEGWKKFNDGNYKSAVANWSGKGESSAQLLYWRARVYLQMGRYATAEELTEELLNRYPLSVYSFMAIPGGSLEITDEPLPEKFTAAPPDDLELWGFMTHARMVLEDKKDLPSRVRRAQLAAWLRQEWYIYRDLRGVVEPLMTGTQISRAMLEIVYPRPFRATVEAAAKRYGIDPLFIWSIMKQESSFDPAARSWVGAAGLLQLMPTTAADEAKKIGLENYSLYIPWDNIELGASHISRLIKRYGRLDLVAAAYNAGAGNVNRWYAGHEDWEADAWMETIPYRETNGYVKNVLRNYAVYQKLYDMTEEIPATQQPEEDPELQTPESPDDGESS